MLIKFFLPFSHKKFYEASTLKICHNLLKIYLLKKEPPFSVTGCSLPKVSFDLDSKHILFCWRVNIDSEWRGEEDRLPPCWHNVHTSTQSSKF